jgi:hypothetical protein
MDCQRCSVTCGVVTAIGDGARGEEDDIDAIPISIDPTSPPRLVLLATSFEPRWPVLGAGRDGLCLQSESVDEAFPRPLTCADVTDVPDPNPVRGIQRGGQGPSAVKVPPRSKKKQPEKTKTKKSVKLGRKRHVQPP